MSSSGSDRVRQSADHQCRRLGHAGAQAGVASAIASTSRQVGQTLGVAVVGALITASVGVVVAAGASRGSRTLHLSAASHAGWWVLVGCGMAVLVLGLVVTTAWARSARCGRPTS